MLCRVNIKLLRNHSTSTKFNYGAYQFFIHKLQKLIVMILKLVHCFPNIPLIIEYFHHDRKKNLEILLP